MNNNPVICAIDNPDLAHAKGLVKNLLPHVGIIKLGLEFFTACGIDGVKEIKNLGAKIFLDLKFHDIPNTVAGAVRSACALDVEMITVHACGGEEMLKAAVKTARNYEKENGKRPLVLAVTVLTSMDKGNLEAVGVRTTSVFEQVKNLAAVAVESEVDGIVCSANELQGLKKEHGNNIIFVVPGIRPEGSSHDDQKRTMTPLKAINEGADYLVIGRPITGSTNPVKAAQDIVSSISI